MHARHHCATSSKSSSKAISTSPASGVRAICRQAGRFHRHPRQGRHWSADASARRARCAHRPFVVKWSPVANAFIRPVHLEVKPGLNGRLGGLDGSARRLASARGDFDARCSIRAVANNQGHAPPDRRRRVRAGSIAGRDLAPLVHGIDARRFLPRSRVARVRRARALTISTCRASPTAAGSRHRHRGHGAVSEYCLSTSFCMWCQNALGWYIDDVRATTISRPTLGPRVSNGEALGGTALSNPMKTFFGIEPIRLKARRVAGGYSVRGVLAIRVQSWRRSLFRRRLRTRGRGPSATSWPIVPCAAEGVELVRQYQVRRARRHAHLLRSDARCVHHRSVGSGRSDRRLHHRAFAPASCCCSPVWLFGLIRSCIALMNQVKGPLGHVNKYLDSSPRISGDTRRHLKPQSSGWP